MFAGSHQLTIDDKGRMAIPARYRQSLADSCNSQLVVTMGPEACLEIYPVQQFQQIVDAIMQLPPRGPAALLRQRFIGLALECEIDKQGRLQLSQFLRSQARLNGSAVLVGNIDHFELWAEDLWNARWSSEGPDSKLGALAEAFQVLNR
jgi:MraZ protein